VVSAVFEVVCVLAGESALGGSVPGDFERQGFGIFLCQQGFPFSFSFLDVGHGGSVIQVGMASVGHCGREKVSSG
jgi:hypothetical protein